MSQTKFRFQGYLAHQPDFQWVINGQGGRGPPKAPPPQWDQRGSALVEFLGREVKPPSQKVILRFQEPLCLTSTETFLHISKLQFNRKTAFKYKTV